MGLALIIVIGTVLGWLSAIVLGRDGWRGAAIGIAAGVAGALLAAIATGPGLLPHGVSPIELVWSALGAVLAIILAHLVSDALRHLLDNRC